MLEAPSNELIKARASILVKLKETKKLGVDISLLP